MTISPTPEAVGSNRWYLSSAPIVRALVHLCVPMAAAMIVGAVYNVINAGFIGSLHDASMLAAVTLGAPLLGLVMAVGGVFGVGGGALISRLLGASEQEPAKAADSAAMIAAMTKRYPNAGMGVALQIGAKVAKGEMKWG